MAVKGIPTGVLVAPDSFKGTFSSAAVAGAIGEGLDGSGWTVDLCPVADGGDGTLAALAGPLGASMVETTVSDPLGRPVRASFGFVAARPRAPASAIVEMAAASGLGLVAEDERDAVRASSAGTGELIVAAVAAGADIVFVGAGGSATTDGGAGAIRAIRDGGGLGGARLVVLCDVRTPFEEAARVFAPQKGASSQEVRRLTARLHRQARAFAREPRGRPMTGAAGGLAGGLWAELGAELVPGAPFVLDAVGFEGRMRSARVVVTGEGRLDRQSLAGKVVSEVATRARQSGVPCCAVVGGRELDTFGVRILDLDVVLQAGSLAALRDAGREIARGLDARR